MSDSDSNEESDWEEVKEEDYILPKLEEVLEEEDKLTAKEYTQQLDIPTGGIEITIEKDGETQRKKKGFDLAGYIRRQVNRRKRELQEDIHKSHVLCLFSRGCSINRILKSEEILAVSLSVLPSKQAYPPKNVDLSYLENFMKWFRKTFKVEQDISNNSDYRNIYSLTEIQSNLSSMMNSKKVVNQDYLVFIFVAILRALGVNVRLVMSLQPMPLKPTSADLMQNPSNQKKGGGRKKSNNNGEDDQGDSDNDGGPSCSKSSSSKTNNNSTKNATKKKDASKSTNKGKAGQGDSSKRAKSESKTNVTESAKPRRGRKAKSVPTKSLKKEEDDEEMEETKFDNSYEPSDFSDTDSDFDLNRSRSSNRKRKKKLEVAAPTPKSKKSKKEVGRGRKMVSSDEDDNDVSGASQTDKSISKKNERKRLFVDVWAEVYLEEEERWVSVDLQSEKIMCDAEFEAKATPPLIYVIAYGNDERVKDVTRRYASRWLTGTQKLRADSSWWQDTLKAFIGKRTRRDKEEDKLLDQQLLNQPIPSSVQEVKGHPLFAMRRHLLKFEDIYPPDPPPVGFIKNEAVYSRDVVHTLHSRELWIKQAKVVRVGEKPYKIVKARPKYDKVTSTMIKDRPLELYGEWQVEDYIPPPAVDGKVPRNEYGNVELFKPTMLPKGTVHLKEAGLSRIAKKLGIDCAPALVGFEFHSGGSHPTYDGFVVCEEFKDVLLDAWREDQIQVQKREEERRRNRVRGNWRRLIRMVIVRRRLERKYESFNFGSTNNSSTGTSNNNNSGPGSSKALNKKKRPSPENPPPSKKSRARKKSSSEVEEKPKKRQQPTRRGRKK